MKNLTVCFYLVLCYWSLIYSTQVIAQPALAWQNTIGSNGIDRINEICQTTDGGYILGGFTTGNIGLDHTENTNGGEDYWVIKIDVAGNIEWQNTIGGSANDQLRSIRQTSDGGYILGGDSNSGISGDKTEATIGQTDYWVIKLDADGEIEWQNTIGGNNYEYLYSIQQTTDGGYITGGQSKSDISGDKTENTISLFAASPTYDFWIVKLTPAGDIEWQNTIGSALNEQLWDLKITQDGGYICVGNGADYLSDDVTVITYCPAGGSWVVKLNSLGNIEWQNSLSGYNASQFHSVNVTNDEGYILAGYANTVDSLCGDQTENGNGAMDGWVIKLNNFGDIEWENMIGGTGVDEFYDIQQTFDGGYIVGGWSNSPIGGDKTEGVMGTMDYWVLKLNSVGNVQWQNTIGGTAEDDLYTLAQSADGGYILGGTSNSTISGDKTETSTTNDFWIIKLDPEECYATSLITPAGPVTFCKGSSVMLTANSGIGLTYQWKRNGANIAGATNINYTANKSGNYTVLVNNGFCNALSPTIVVTVNNTPTATITNMDATNNLCIDASIKLKANGGAGFTYQWYKGASALVGETGQFYFATTTGNYKVKVTNASGCSKTSAPYAIVNECKLENENLQSITLYPNPTSDIINIELPEVGNYTIQITDISGKTIFCSEVTKQTVVSIDVSNWAANVYVVAIRNETFEFKEKVVKID